MVLPRRQLLSSQTTRYSPQLLNSQLTSLVSSSQSCCSDSSSVGMGSRLNSLIVCGIFQTMLTSTSPSAFSMESRSTCATSSWRCTSRGMSRRFASECSRHFPKPTRPASHTFVMFHAVSPSCCGSNGLPFGRALYVLAFRPRVMSPHRWAFMNLSWSIGLMNGLQTLSASVMSLADGGGGVPCGVGCAPFFPAASAFSCRSRCPSGVLLEDADGVPPRIAAR